MFETVVSVLKEIEGFCCCYLCKLMFEKEESHPNTPFVQESFYKYG